MCKNCCNRWRCCDRHWGCRDFCDNRCEDLLFPLMFWMLRQSQIGCRCNFVDRYDRFRC